MVNMLKLTMELFNMKFCIILLLILSDTYGKIDCAVQYEDEYVINDKNVNDRVDCYPESNSNPTKCASRGCLWDCNAKTTLINYPCCYFPINYMHYITNVSSWHINDFKISGRIQFVGKYVRYPTNYDELIVEITALSQYALNIKILDPKKERFTISDLLENTNREISINDSFIVNINPSPFYMKIARRSTGEILMDTSVTPIIYTDQYLEISTSVTSMYSYGIGQRAGQLILKHQWETYGIFNTDSGFYETNKNLYGSHPFSLHIEKTNKSYGILFLNSNAMEIQARPYPGLTYRTIGGVIEFVIVIGDTHDQTISQYNNIIGRPILPPKWALGFHICRYGYKNVDEFMTIIEKMRYDGIPIDVQWIDIDVFDKYQDFTIGTNFKNIGNAISKLHSYNMKFVVIIDAGIPVDDHSWNSSLFIKQQNSNYSIVGKVWPGYVVYPDFTNEQTLSTWTTAFAQFHEKLQFDGIWLDMNEVSNFVDGSINGCPHKNNTLDYPPYMPKLHQRYLFTKTICMSSVLNKSSNYNLHNLFGYLESKATRSALDTILNKNSLIISRSTFVGQGKYGGSWQGDNYSSWYQLYLSIPAMLAFNMFGIPFTGSDVCGFNGDSTDELCTRWTQMAAFFPFIRNHHSNDSKNQHPYSFSGKHTQAVKKVLRMRYQIIPYLQSLFVQVHVNKIGTVARPLFFNYPTDIITYNIDDQFMLGDSLLIIPQLRKGYLTTKAYFPKDTWYTFNGSYWLTFNSGQYYDLYTPYNEINVFYRQCSIIPTQHPYSTVFDSEKMPLNLIVTMKKSEPILSADSPCTRYEGHFYTYDDDSLDREPTLHLNFVIVENTLISAVDHYTSITNREFGTIEFFGFPENPKIIFSSVKIQSSSYDNETKIFKLNLDGIKIHSPLKIVWSF